MGYSLDVVTVQGIGSGVAGVTPLGDHETVDTFNVMYQGNDAASKDQQKRDDAEYAHGVETEESDWSCMSKRDRDEASHHAPLIQVWLGISMNSLT